jgi:hypothetical protein
VTKRAQLISSHMNATLNHGDKDNIQLSAVEDYDGILTIRGGGARRDWNGIHYKQGMSAKNVGTTNLSANIATIPPGGVAYAHIHVGFEVILYISSKEKSGTNSDPGSSRLSKTKPAISFTLNRACPTKSST